MGFRLADPQPGDIVYADMDSDGGVAQVVKFVPDISKETGFDDGPGWEVELINPGTGRGNGDFLVIPSGNIWDLTKMRKAGAIR